MNSLQNRTLLYVCGRTTLMKFLASGLITQANVLDREREDLLISHYPGRCPFFLDGVPLDAVEPIFATSLTDFPVALEISDFWKSVIYDNCEWSKDKLSLSSPGILPIFDSVSLIHFSSESDEREFSSSHFADFALDRIPTQVSPDLFSGTYPGVVPEKPKRVLKKDKWLEIDDFKRESRIAGGVALAAYAGDYEPDLMKELLKVSEAVSPSSGSIKNNLTSILSGIRRPKSKTESPHSHLLSCIVERLVNGDAKIDGDTVSILSDINEQFSKYDFDDSNSELAQIVGAFSKARSILLNDSPFVGLRDPKALIEGALLLFLMRPTVDDVLTWKIGNDGVTAEHRCLAAFFAGLFRGLAPLSSTFKASPIFEALSYNIASNLTAGKRKKVGPQSVFDRVSPDTMKYYRLLRSDWNAQAISKELERLCEEHSWTDCFTTVIYASSYSVQHTKNGMELSFEDGFELVKELDHKKLAHRIENKLDSRYRLAS